MKNTFYQDLKQGLKEIGIGPEYRTMIYGVVEETIARHLVAGTFLIRGWIRVTTYAKFRKNVRDLVTGRQISDRVVVTARAKVGPRLKRKILEGQTK